eukprot:3611121-Rhodomonas_salina.2
MIALTFLQPLATRRLCTIKAAGVQNGFSACHVLACIRKFTLNDNLSTSLLASRQRLDRDGAMGGGRPVPGYG